MSGLVLKITLENTHPPVWRRVLIPEKTSFYDLHMVIQILFGWEDEHLHGFIDRDHRDIIKVTEDPEKPAEDKKTPIDRYFWFYPWMRYIYDYGDNWSHKVTLEKEDPDYQEPYAKLLKAKGDNYAEDSGGVWGNDARIPFDETAVNQRLQEFPISPLSGQSPDKADVSDDILDSYKELIDKMYTELLENQDRIIDAYKNLLEDLEAYEKERMYLGSVSGIQKYLDQWFAFCDELSDWNEEENRKKRSEKTQKRKVTAEPEYEQMTLPFVESTLNHGNTTPKEKTEFQGFRIVASGSEHTPVELMCRLKKSEGIDFCKYLCLDVAGKKKKADYFQAVADFLREHPSYCLYLIPKEGLHGLAQLRKDDIPADDQLRKVQRAVAYMMALGLAEVDYLEEDGWKTARILFTDVAEAVLQLDGEKTTKELYRRLEQWDEVSAAVLQLYGAIEIPVLYEKCCETGGFHVDLIEFQRYLYWHCRMPGYIRTGTDKETGVPIASTNDVNLFEAVSLQHKYLEEMPYKPFSSKDLRNYLEEGVTAICPQWTNLEEYLRSRSVSDSEIEYWITEWLCELTDGENATEFQREIIEMLEEQASLSVIDRVTIWEMSIVLTMHQGVAALKGYSREEFRKKCGFIPEELPVINTSLRSKLQKGYQIRTHLMDMPDEIQMALYDVITMDEKEAPGAFADIRKRYGENVELFCLEASFFSKRGELEQAQAFLKRAASLAESEDVSEIEAAISYIRSLRQMESMQDERYEEDWFYEKETPYRRSAPKIGRNAPCPCGSGKKYKKCCGRNI